MRAPSRLADPNRLAGYRWFALGAFFVSWFFDGWHLAIPIPFKAGLVALAMGSAALMWLTVDQLMRNEYESRVCFWRELILWPWLWPARAIRTRGWRGALWSVAVAMGAIGALAAGDLASR